MMNFVDIIAIYNEVKLPNYTVRCLMSENAAERAWAVDTLRAANLQTRDDVLLFLANGIM